MKQIDFSKLMNRIAKSDNCWIWLGAKHPLGYGNLKVGKSTQYAHRAVYEAIVGEIPKGLSLDHLCREPSCVNPEHLQPVTHKENVLRGVGPTAVNAKKTHCKNGHELNKENVKMVGPKKERRMCHPCAKAQWRAISKAKHAKKESI